MSRYLVYMESAEESGYPVYVPALRGCVSEGDTEEEALEMVKDAIIPQVAMSMTTPERFAELPYDPRELGRQWQERY